MAGLEPKAPSEVRDYTFDWSVFLGADTITGSTVTVAGVTLVDDTNDTTSVSVVVSGGTLDTIATIVNTITTDGGLTETETFTLPIRTNEPISVPQAKAHLRVFDDSEDALIEGYIVAARQWVENYTGHVLSRRTFIEQHSAWGDYITLYRQPVATITTIEYDSADADQVEFEDFAFSFGSHPTRIMPTSSFPSLRANGYITVTYTAGYAAGETPEALLQAVLLMVGHFYTIRSGVSIDEPNEVPLAVKSLCTPYRGLVMA